MSKSQLQPHGNRPDPLPYELVIRFSASLPDLQVVLTPSQNATISTLKQLIRESLPSNLKDRRIRLICAGKALVDDASLSSVLKRTISHPPSRSATPGPYDGGSLAAAKGKGKESVRDLPAQSKIYIHCSIGDVVLSAAELAAEAAVATKQDGSSSNDGMSAETQLQQDESTTIPAPRGFDRLLTAGFTAAEVGNLRLQFRTLQEHTHTPDTMPSPDTLRDMEDRWLDSGNGAGSAIDNGAGGSFDDDGSAGAMDDMLWGAAMGFFWPVGCMFWGMREQGVWSHRRGMAVVLGVALNIGLGLIRYTDS